MTGSPEDKRRFGFPLRALFTCVLLVSILLGLLRFLALHPEAAGPVLFLCAIIVIVQGPHMVRGYESAGVRLALGCVVIPILTVVGAVFLTLCIALLRALMLTD